MNNNEKINQLLSERFESSPKDTLEMKLEELPLDSMDLVDLIYEIEDILDVNVDNVMDVDYSLTVAQYISLLSPSMEAAIS